MAAVRERRWRLGAGLVATAVLLGTNVAWASFASVATATAGSYGTLTLSAPTLTCNPGGLLVSTVVLHLSSVDHVADPYRPAGTSKISGYVIERTAAGGSTYSTLATVSSLGPLGSATNYTDTPGGLLGVYKYRIRATKGNWVSPVSNIVTAHSTSILFLGLSTTCN
jgi:hypothetical protein